MQTQEKHSLPITVTENSRRRLDNAVWHTRAGLVLTVLLTLLGASATYSQYNSPDNEIGSLATPSHSTTIALTSDDQRLVVVNRQNDSVSIIQVRDNAGYDAYQKLAEVTVGNEPRFVALTPDNQEAYVTNAASGTVSVISLTGQYPYTVAQTIEVGNEPRGIAITPNGAYAFVALHTEGKVAVISTQNKQVLYTVKTGGNPQAVAITHNGDDKDDDERVFVTRFFGELIDPKNRPDGFDDAKQGVIDSFTVQGALSGSAQVQTHVLSPLKDSGFKADRRSFCLKTRQILQDQGDENGVKTVFFNSGPNQDGNGAEQLANEVFCPDPNSEDASTTGLIANTPQGVYPNALHDVLIRDNYLYVPNVGAQPEPVIRFSVNVQYLVGVIDITSGKESEGTVNVNTQIATEPGAGFDPILDHLFGNDPGCMDASRDGKLFLLVSRGGNYVMEATLDDKGKLNIGAPNDVIRYQTGNMPTCVVMSSDTKRAYTNNEINTSVTAIDLVDKKVLERDIDSSTPPEPGSQAHRNIVGKLVFFTALGTPDVLDTDGDGQFDIEIRDLVPLDFRGKASDNAWSSCASCHDDGRTDNVVWSFETGPRKSKDLSGTFAKIDDPESDQGILNWSNVRGSNTDFNANSIGIQGGIGFATDVNGVDRTAEIFNHGPVKGISDALDALQEWVANAIRPLNFPDGDLQLVERGSKVFEDGCASCHGGDKWTKSRTSPVYDNDPTYPENPIGENFFVPVEPIDPRVVDAAPQIIAVQDEKAGKLTLMDDVGTFDPQNPIELRGGAAVAGQSTAGFPALGGVGFGPPSLFNVAYHAPFLHNGSAPTLEDLFAVHRLPQIQDNPTIQQWLNTSDRDALEAFLTTIDEDTARFQSDTDRFLDQLGLP